MHPIQAQDRFREHDQNQTYEQSRHLSILFYSQQVNINSQDQRPRAQDEA